MISNTTATTLTVASDRLVSGAYFSILATVSTDTKTISQEITPQVSLNATGSIEFSPIYGTVNNDVSYLITPKFTESKNMRFLWNFNPSIDSNAIDLTLPYLYIPENYTLPGVTYRLTLTMTNDLNYSISGYTFFTRTSPPICGKFTAKLSST